MTNKQKRESINAFNCIAMNPQTRILLTGDLTEKLGMLLAMPAAQLEQLIVAGKEDVKILENAPSDFLETLGPIASMAATMATRQLAILEGFLLARPRIIKFVKDQGIDTIELEN